VIWKLSLCHVLLHGVLLMSAQQQAVSCMLTQQTAAIFRRSVWSSLASQTEGLEFMAQAVSRRPLSEEALVHSQAGSCDIYGGQSDTGTCFSPVPLFSPASIIPPMRHIY
jgi:hypothetical protein